MAERGASVNNVLGSTVHGMNPIPLYIHNIARALELRRSHIITRNQQIASPLTRLNAARVGRCLIKYVTL